ncbi:MAG: HEAT repeat domain-containing protein [Candidatus Omnitrophica bacterium]|nr:HEAT repeat domain-containing protein [Candidatus Omnitrophota bacterium]
MFNYHADIVWVINKVLFGALILTSAVIFFCAVIKNYIWEKRRQGLLKIKNDIYEMVLSGKSFTEGVRHPLFTGITPQQFIDIETNRSIDAAFFNDSEQQLLKGCFREPEKIAELNKIVERSNDKWHRIEAMLCLGYSEAETAIDVLSESLSSRDEDIAYFAMISLAQIKTMRSAKALLGFLRKKPSNGYKIASILGNFPKEIADEAVKLTDDKDPRIRICGVTILSKLASRQHIAKLEKLTGDEVAEVRAGACDCLGRIGGEGVKVALRKRLKDDSWLVKRHAIFGLAKAIGDDAVPEVIKLINDASWSVLDAVKDVMAEHIKASLPDIEKFIAGGEYIPKKYSIMALESASKNADPSVRAKVAKILAKIDNGL